MPVDFTNKMFKIKVRGLKQFLTFIGCKQRKKMPPRRSRQARSSGYDPTVSKSAASAARSEFINTNEETKQDNTSNQQSSSDDLKKLIETLKNKLNSNTSQEKKAPPSPRVKTIWDRSIEKKPATFKPAYSVLTRISNHEKVPAKSTRTPDLTTKSLPDSFLFRPGADGIEIDKKLKVQSGKQIGLG